MSCHVGPSVLGAGAGSDSETDDGPPPDPDEPPIVIVPTLAQGNAPASQSVLLDYVCHSFNLLRPKANPHFR